MLKYLNRGGTPEFTRGFLSQFKSVIALALSIEVIFWSFMGF